MAAQPASNNKSGWRWLQGLLDRPRGSTLDDDAPPQHRGLTIGACVLLSSFLWFSFSIQETYTTTLDLPTEVEPLTDDRALVSLPPDHVRVTVQGEGLRLLKLYYNPPAIPINTTVDEVNLEEITTEVVKDVSLEGVFPNTIRLRKEARITRRIPIANTVILKTPDTYDLLDLPLLSPDSVSVTGARSLVAGLRAWPTERRQFVNVKDTFRVQVALLDSLPGLIVRDVRTTVLTAISAPFTESQRVLEVTVEGAPDEEKVVTLVPPTVMVRYNVHLGQLDDALRAPDFRATVSYADIQADTTGRVRPFIHRPAGIVIRDIRIDPATLQYYNFVDDQ